MPREVMRNIYRIPVPLPNNPLRELNCYLIRAKDRSLLIDTGFRQETCRRALFDGLRELNVRMEDTDILLTHLHSDHTGLLPEVASATSRVFIDDLDRDWIVGSTRFELERQEDARFAMAGIPPEMLRIASQTHPGRCFAPDPSFDRYTRRGMCWRWGAIAWRSSVPRATRPATCACGWRSSRPCLPATMCCSTSPPTSPAGPIWKMPWAVTCAV